MKTYDAKDIRNVLLVGHGGAGKTTLLEAMPFTAGATTRMGTVEDGTTVSDHDPDEQRKGISVSLAMAPIEWEGVKINVLDAPGSRDITAGVDLEALVSHARGRGWSVWGPVSQRELHEALGIERFERDALRAQQAALDDRRGLDAVRLYSERNRLRLLTGPAGLGGLQAVCVGVGTDRAPRWAAASS